MLLDELVKDKNYKIEQFMHNFNEPKETKTRNLKSISGNVIFKKSSELENNNFIYKYFKSISIPFYHFELFEKNNRKFCIIKESIVRQKKGVFYLNLSPISERELIDKIKNHIIINNKSMNQVDFLKIKEKVKTIDYSKIDTGFYYDDFLRKKIKF
jgi:hypothetical protein